MFGQMSKPIYRYTFDDLKNPANNCIVSTMVQLAERCKMPYRTIQDILLKNNVYYEKNGLFKIERRRHYTAVSKARKQ